tara:strand:- start:126 stop:821 length:696 start_codon:yes stop_codon:yes gene_type:complete
MSKLTSSLMKKHLSQINKQLRKQLIKNIWKMKKTELTKTFNKHLEKSGEFYRPKKSLNKMYSNTTWDLNEFKKLSVTLKPTAKGVMKVQEKIKDKRTLTKSSIKPQLTKSKLKTLITPEEILKKSQAMIKAIDDLAKLGSTRKRADTFMKKNKKKNKTDTWKNTLEELNKIIIRRNKAENKIKPQIVQNIMSSNDKKRKLKIRQYAELTVKFNRTANKVNRNLLDALRREY